MYLRQIGADRFEITFASATKNRRSPPRQSPTSSPVLEPTQHRQWHFHQTLLPPHPCRDEQTATDNNQLSGCCDALLLIPGHITLKYRLPERGMKLLLLRGVSGRGTESVRTSTKGRRRFWRLRRRDRTGFAYLGTTSDFHTGTPNPKRHSHLRIVIRHRTGHLRRFG